MESLASLPLGFEQNQGQAEAGIQFIARTSAYSAYFSRDALLVRFDQVSKDRDKAEEIRISIVGSDRGVEPRGIDVLPGTINYYIGKDPAQWRAGVKQFGRVRFSNIYPGIDLVVYGNRQQPEFDFRVAPGAHVSKIGLQIQGAAVKPAKGSLELITPSGRTLTLRKPTAYQDTGRSRRRVPGSFVLRRSNQVGFCVGPYDRTKALVIDPALIYSTLLGLSLNDRRPFAIAVDGSGAGYITGESISPGPTQSAFVIKLDPSGSTLVYETHLAGVHAVGTGIPDMPAAGFGIGVDANLNSYVVGLTDETDFPTTAGAFSTTAFCATTTGNVGCVEPFAFKLDATGKLAYSTFLVQTALDNAGPVPSSVAVDSAGAIYVTGTTAQQNSGSVLTVAGLPTTSGAFQTTRKNNSSAFVLKLHPDGSKLDYSTYLGGSTGETPGGIAVDANSVAYVDGGTSSSDFPVTPGASLTTNPGTAAFYSKLKADGSGLLYSTFLAAKGEVEGTSIAIDPGLAAYLTGLSGSCNQASASSPEFAAKFDASGNLVYSTAVGTQTCAPDLLIFGSPLQSSIAVDNTGAAYVASGTGGAFQSSINVSKLDSSGAVVYTAPVGPINPSNSRFGGAALDSQQNFYVTGVAGSLEDRAGVPTIIPDIGTTAGAFQVLPIGDDPQEIMFVQKWAQSLGAAVPIPNPRQVKFSPILQQGVTSSPRTIQLFNYGDADLAISGISLGGVNASDFAISSSNNTCGATVVVGSSCSFLVTFTPTVGVGTRNATVTLSFGGGVTSQTAALIGQAGTPAFAASPSPVDFGNAGVGGTSSINNLTITNNGTGQMNLLSLPVFQGSNPSDFSICVLAVSTCGGQFNPPSSIAAGSSFIFPLVFTPTGSGPRTAQIVFDTDAPGSPQSVQLKGNGIAIGNGGFNLTGSGSSTATVAAGQTATYSLLAVSNQGFNRNVSVTVTCGGAPSAASCTVNPSSFNIISGPAGSGLQTLAVSVTTTPRTSGSLQRMFPVLGWPVVASIGIVALRRKRVRTRMVITLSVMAVLGLAVSCGGGVPHNSGTPAGTYTLTVTATGNGASNSVPLTLNVQ